MRRLLALVLLSLLVVAVPSVNAEYEDLRTPEEKEGGVFLGSYSSCVTCARPETRKETKKKAIEIAKEGGRSFCKKRGWKAVYFWDIKIQEESSDLSRHNFTARVNATCLN